jgi:hypothetical protein
LRCFHGSVQWLVSDSHPASDIREVVVPLRNRIDSVK